MQKVYLLKDRTRNLVLFWMVLIAAIFRNLPFTGLLPFSLKILLGFASVRSTW